MPPTPTAYVSRPALTLDGQDVPAVDLQVVAAFAEETADGLYRCEVTLSNFGAAGSGAADYLYFGRDVIDFGKALTLRLGPGDPPETVFEGRITALEADYPPEGESRLIVLAEDRLQDLRMKRQSRSFEDMSDADVITQIANEHNLTPEVDLNGPTHRALAQVNQSDLAFIRERARAVDGEVWVEGTTLYAKARADRGWTSVAVLAYGTNLLAFTVRADLAHQVTEVHVGGWDVQAKEAIDESADDAVVSSETGGATGGSSVLSSALADRTEAVVHSAPLTAAQARAEAEARYLARARRFVTGSGVADGDPALRVGAGVNLSGLGPLFDGGYVLVRVRHAFDLANGYRTEFDVERAFIGG